MDTESAQKYCDLMAQVKLRNYVVYALMDGRLNVGYRATTIEAVYLQFRKILELIALGSLVANKEIFSNVHEKFSKYRNAKLLIKEIERINPNFYPRPFITKLNDKSGAEGEWVDRPNDYLTKEDLIKLHEKCNAIMHSENPYGSKIDYKYYEDMMKNWASRIMKLLDKHSISLVNDSNLYYIQMGTKDQPPSCGTWARKE
jgi:hypothetical protein